MRLLYFLLYLCLTFLSTTNSLLSQNEVSPRWKTNYEGENIIHSPNGKFIVCVRAKDYIVRDAYTLKQICSEKFPSSYNTAAPQFTPDGSRFVLFNNHEVIIVETESGRILHSLKNDIYSVEVIKISRNGKLLAVYDGRINVYEINTGNLLFTKYYEELDDTNFIDFSPDDSLLVTQSEFSGICVLDTKVGDTLYCFYNRYPQKYTILEIVNAEYICYRSESYDTVDVADIKTGQFIKSLPAKNTFIPSSHSRIRESILPLYTYADSVTTLYSMPEFEPLFRFKRWIHEWSTDIYYDTYGKHLYYFDSDTIHCWDIKSGKLILKFYLNKEYCQNNLISINPDWKTAIFDKGTHLMVIDIRTHNRVSYLESRKISDAIFSPSGDTVFTMGAFFSTRSTQTGQIISETCNPFPRYTGLLHTTYKKIVAYSNIYRKATIYDVKNNVVSDEIYCPLIPYSPNISISKDSRRILLNSTTDFSAIIVGMYDDLFTYIPSYPVHHFYEGLLRYTEFNNRGDGIAMCGKDKYNKDVVLIYDWNGEKTDYQPKTLFPHTCEVFQIRFSKDDKYIVTSCSDSSTKVWNVATEKIVAVLEHQNSVKRAQFIQNDSTILTTDSDTNVLVWNVRTQKILHNINDKEGIASMEVDDIGNVLLINCYDKKSPSLRFVTLWDLRTGKKIKQFDSDGIGHINKQGTKIVLVRNRCVELWDVQDIIASSFGDVLEHNASRLTISPTPAESNVEITLPTDFVCEADFEISNVFGDVVSSGIVPFSGSNKFTIDCSNLSNGMYFLTIKTNGKSASQKLIISR